MALVAVMLVSLVLPLLTGAAPALAQPAPAYIKQARVLEMDDTGVAHPAGLAYSPRANLFHMMDGTRRGQPNTDMVRISVFAQRTGATRIAAQIRDPRLMAYDPLRDRLLIFQSPNNHLIEVRARADGSLDPATLTRHSARHFEIGRAHV